MVGLSVVLEAHKLNNNAATSTGSHFTEKTVMPLLINKATMVKPPPPTHLPPPPSTHPLAAGSADRSFHYPPPVGGGFLDACCLCRQRLLPGKDIYMYKGDKAFCSEECRWKQMLIDEYDEDNSPPPPLNNNNYYYSGMKML